MRAADVTLLNSQLVDIARSLRDRPATPDGDGWRVGRSLKIWPGGRWYDHKNKQGGRGSLSCITHYRPCTLAEAETWATTWLATHPTPGLCVGSGEDDAEDTADTAERRAFIETLYAARQPIPGTPGAAYLDSRGIHPAQLRPEILA